MDGPARDDRTRVPDRVTLKKEIGLLSACTIIIGELRVCRRVLIRIPAVSRRVFLD